jgi:hypothetical protein
LSRTLQLLYSIAIASAAWTHAAAQSPAPPQSAAPAAPSASAPPAAPAQPQQSARHTDAHADRVILVPTAETHPAGTLYLTSYEIVIPQVGYAFSDRLQAEVLGFTDFDDGVFVDLSVKGNLLRSRYLRVAALSSIDYARSDVDELLFGRAGGIAQFCIDLPCRSSVSLSAMVLVHDELATILPLGFGAGFTAEITDGLSALIEYSALVNAAREFEFVNLPVYLVGYGLRIAPRPSWTLEVTLLRDLASDEEIATGGVELFDLLGVPLLAFTYRFLP